MMYPTNPTGYFNNPEPPLDPPDCLEPEPTPPPEPKLFQPLERYTLSEIKEYCEAWEDCPKTADARFTNFAGCVLANGKGYRRLY